MKWMSLQQVLDLFARYPFLWAPTVATLWAVVTGVLSWALDHTMPRTDAEWSDLFTRKPRLAGMAALLKTAGFNLPGVVRSMRALLSGPPPFVPPPRTKEELLAAALTLGALEREHIIEALRTPVDTKPTPPRGA